MGVAWNGTYFSGESHPPYIEIGDVTGGFGVNTVIKNILCGDAVNVEWSVRFKDGLILLPQDRCIEGVIPRIESGSETTVKSGLVFGIGVTEINVTASVSYANTATKFVQGFVFGPFVFIKDG